MNTAQTPGHLFGPPPPHIGFWYGDQFLGETRGHPSNVQAAQTKLLGHIDILGHGDPYCSIGAQRARLLRYSHAKLYCGPLSVTLQTRQGWH